MGLVIFKEANVGFEVFGEQDSKTISLIGLIDFSLVDAVNKVGSSQFGLIRRLRWKIPCTFSRRITKTFI